LRTAESLMYVSVHKKCKQHHSKPKSPEVFRKSISEYLYKSLREGLG